MGLTIEDTNLDGVKVISPDTNFEDFRGRYIELWNKDLFESAGISLDFKQDDISISRQHVLRGLHGDRSTWKLVTCLSGTFYLVVVNNIETSQQYKQWQAFTLSDRENKQILIPPGFGNGHLVMSETSIFHYKQTTTYDRSSQFTLLWNDPTLNIWWPINTPILSQRDTFGD